MTRDQAKALWDDYCEAATPSGTNDNDIELFDIEEMNEAAHAIYVALLAAIGQEKPHE